MEEFYELNSFVVSPLTPFVPVYNKKPPPRPRRTLYFLQVGCLHHHATRGSSRRLADFADKIPDLGTVLTYACSTAHPRLISCQPAGGDSTSHDTACSSEKTLMETAHCTAPVPRFFSITACCCGGCGCPGYCYLGPGHQDLRRGDGRTRWLLL